MNQANLSRHRAGGFTILELLVVIALIGIVSTIGFPALMNTLRRAQVTGAAKDVANAIRVARLEAIKRSRPVGAQAQIDSNEVHVFEDLDGNGVLDAGEQFNTFPLRAAIQFWAPDEAPGGSGVVVGFNETLPDGSEDATKGWVLFASDGSANETGAFRIGDGHGNHFEIRVDPRASARVTILKWDPVETEFEVQGEGGESWEFY